MNYMTVYEVLLRIWFALGGMLRRPRKQVGFAEKRNRKMPGFFSCSLTGTFWAREVFTLITLIAVFRSCFPVQEVRLYKLSMLATG